ncbi:MAG: enoyl-CoA hydratase/isomerase family protein, partial [Paracoccaceae bacterium]|nr:enoyl-CoA hydratase/isomerase family protein [Paracoccaceae bacterium]
FILTGTGRVFSAGADLDAAKAGLATSPDWERLSNAIAALPGLTVAALNGTVAGGACGMAFACDLRITTEGAKLFYPVMRLGFLPQPSDVVRMSRLIGPAQTKRILMAGQKITASDALDMGLFQQIVPEGSLLATARDLGSDAMGADLRHVSAIKSMIDAAASCPATSTTA